MWGASKSLRLFFFAIPINILLLQFGILSLQILRDEVGHHRAHMFDEERVGDAVT